MTNYFDYTIVVVLGLIIGSFLNVVILRFDDLKSIITGRSHCPHCKKDLVWYELIPVLSYIALQGKCSKCKKPISFQYPLVELGTVLVFLLIFWKFGFSIVALFLALISCSLIVACVYDILEMEIADWLVWKGIGLWVVYLAINYFFFSHSALLTINSLYGALALGGFFGLLVLVSKEKWMGAGDIGLGALIGFILGWPNVLVAGFLAFVIGAIIGVILLLNKTSKLNSQVPFAPFLILGFWLTLFWGSNILNWYTGLFFRGVL